jgi:hypothetical protein
VENQAVQVVLIGGAQRSGTTLLQTLLANAASSPVLPEAHILCDLMAAFKRAKDAPKKTEFYYASGDKLLAFFRSCAERHMADLAQRLGGPDILVLKDPNFARFDAEVSSILPKAIRVICLRDPRDIAASFLKIGRRQTEGEAGKYRRRDIHFIAKKIVEAYAGLTRDPLPRNLHFVRYEELAETPAKVLQDLASTTGLRLSLDRVDNPVWLKAEARHEEAWTSPLEEQKPSTESVGAYRDEMRPREIAIIEQICAPVMSFAGYEPSSLRASRVLTGPTKLASDFLDRVRRSYWAYRARFP